MTQSEHVTQDEVGMHPQIAALRRAKGSNHSDMYRKVQNKSGNVVTEHIPESPQTNVMATDSTMNTEQQTTTMTNNNSGEDNDTNVDWAKRYSDARRYQQELQDQIKELNTKLGEVTKEKVILPKSDEELESWKKDHPDLYDTVVTVYRKETEQYINQLNEAKEELDRIKNANKKEAIFSEVLKEHRDADDIRKSTEFKTWYAEQTQGIRSLIDSTDAKDIVKGIFIYKADKGMLNTPDTTNSYKSADAASAVDTRSNTALPTPTKEWTDAEVKKLSEAEYARYRNDIIAWRTSQKRR